MIDRQALRRAVERFLERLWYQAGLLSTLLLPCSALYALVVILRRRCYRIGLLRAGHPGVPVIVVGNLSVGGTGKTPLVVWLANHLRQEGLRPGIVSRGYGRRGAQPLLRVTSGGDPAEAGDEPVLIARCTDCPVIVAGDKLRAAVLLAEELCCDIVISDDGLQHYRLRRDIEICVIDGERRFGNGRCLPAGPLREPRSRLDEVALRVGNGHAAQHEHLMELQVGQLCNLFDAGRALALEEWAGRTVHAVAGIGNPERFFTLLARAGVRVIRHSFPDHHPYRAEDVHFDDELPVVMTEKDAVKCTGFCTGRHWSLPVCARLPDDFASQLKALIDHAMRVLATPAMGAQRCPGGGVGEGGEADEQKTA